MADRTFESSTFSTSLGSQFAANATKLKMTTDDDTRNVRPAVTINGTGTGNYFYTARTTYAQGAGAQSALTTQARTALNVTNGSSADFAFGSAIPSQSVYNTFTNTTRIYYYITPSTS